MLHGVSYLSDLAHRDVLEGLERDGTYPLRCVPTVSRSHEPGNAGSRGRTGRVEQVVGSVCDDLGLRGDQTVVYVCGNPGMIANVERVLVDRRYPGSHLRKELYWPPGDRPEWIRRAEAKDISGTA